MHQKYTLTICDIEINVISDESPEAVEALVSIVDRKMRDISQKSKSCSKTEAAILCSLDYCSDKLRAQRKVKAVESKLANTETVMDELIGENEELKQEISELKKKLEAAENKISKFENENAEEQPKESSEEKPKKSRAKNKK